MDKHLQTFDAVHAELPAFEGAAVPEWVHLLPTSSGAVQTLDKRGPYHVNDAELIIQNSFAEADKLPIDQDHAMDLAAKDGRPAPARGWIVEMQSRQDGIWGHVEWTKSGRALLEDRAYSGISPVIGHLATPGKDIVAIRRASLVNRPNLRGLNSLNQETDTMFQENIAKLLGLKADASEGDITTALNARLETDSVALQSQLGEIGTALGCETDATAEDILTAAQSASSGKDETITALQASVKDLSQTVTTLQEGEKKAAAVAFVDGAIRDGHVGVKPAREQYIAMHQADPEGVQNLIGKMPKIKGELLPDTPPGDGDTNLALNAQELSAKATALVAKQAEAGIEMSITEAVQAVQEGVA
ncbi:phage protease [Pseudophaeobacter sp.]|uniref:phage protease n=1 Tax=Pseudophaeobacter sp. TaxID=1971739 RepID=UPI0032979B4B